MPSAGSMWTGLTSGCCHERDCHVVIVGATGMVGGYVLRYALGDPTVSRVTAIGRRSLGVSHPKVKEVLRKDFADCSRFCL